MAETVKHSGLTKKQLAVLKQYEHTSDGNFMQGIKGAGDLYPEYLQWHGSQYGCQFYSITPEGRAAISRATSSEGTEQ